MPLKLNNPYTNSIAYLFNNCQNFKGPAFCGTNVTSMYSTYLNCKNLTGSPVCGPNVINMSNTYNNCTNLTGSPVCGPNVTNMSYTYRNCFNLTGSPVCGPNVTNMFDAYRNCYNLTGSPVCGPNVTNMYCVYANCFGLYGTTTIGPAVTNMAYTFYNVPNIYGDMPIYSNVSNASYAFYNRRNDVMLNLFIANNASTINAIKNSTTNGSGASWTNSNWTFNWDIKSYYHKNSNTMIFTHTGNNVSDMMNLRNEVSLRYYTTEHSEYATFNPEYNCSISANPDLSTGLIEVTYYSHNDGEMPTSIDLSSVVNNGAKTLKYITYANLSNAVNIANFARGANLVNQSFLTEFYDMPKVVNMHGAFAYSNYCGGNAVCGPNVIDMSCAYSSATNVNNPVCGPNVINMYKAYSAVNSFYGSAIYGSPVCGNKVVNFAGAYGYCPYLTGQPVCGPNVTDMCDTFDHCYNLTGDPVCGDKVRNMVNTYYYGYNITGQPVCGPNVINMCNTYGYCKNMIGKPVCGPNVVDMSNTYQSCYNLIGQPVCGDKVKYMGRTYSGCNNLTGSPVCGPNVIVMEYTYSSCRNLTGEPVCGPNVTNMWGTYSGCGNLTGAGIIGPNVTYALYAYAGCSNIKKVYVLPDNLINIGGIVNGCTNTVIYVNKNSATHNAMLRTEWGNTVTYGYISWTNAVENGVNVHKSNISNLTIYPVDDVSDLYRQNELKLVYYKTISAPGDDVPIIDDGYNNYTLNAISVSGGYDVKVIPGELYYNARHIYFNQSSNLVSVYSMPSTIDNMYRTFQRCINLTGTPESILPTFKGTNMRAAFNYCRNITGNPVCGSSVKDMAYAYASCINLTGSPVCGPSVEDMAYAYSDCLNLTGDIACEKNVINMCGTYYNCTNLFNNDVYLYSNKINNIANCFYGKNNSTMLNIHLYANGYNSTHNTLNSCLTQPLAGNLISWTNDATNRRYYNTSYNIYLYPTDIVSQAYYKVQNMSGSTYGFVYDSASDMYISNNRNVNSSYAICNVLIYNPGGRDIYFEYMQSSEGNYDYGFIGLANATFNLSNYTESSNCLVNAYGKNSTTTVYNAYAGKINGFVHVKYRKDSSVNNGEDSFKFRVVIK